MELHTLSRGEQSFATILHRELAACTSREAEERCRERLTKFTGDTVKRHFGRPYSTAELMKLARSRKAADRKLYDDIVAVRGKCLVEGILH